MFAAAAALQQLGAQAGATPLCPTDFFLPVLAYTSPQKFSPGRLAASAYHQTARRVRKAEELSKHQCSHNALMAGHLPLRGTSPKPHRDEASHQPPVSAGLGAMHLWPLQKLFPTLLCSPPCALGQAAQWLHWGLTLGFALPTPTCQRSEASSSECLK